MHGHDGCRMKMLGDHGFIFKGCRFYEGALHVPLIFSWPGHFRQGLVCDSLVELTDLAPALADVGGAALELTHDKSLLLLLKGEPGYTFTTPLEHIPTYGTMYFDGRFKLIVYHGLDFGELYDLEKDPGEYDNLRESPALSKVKMDLLKRSFDASIVITDPGPPQIGRY